MTRPPVLPSLATALLACATSGAPPPRPAPTVPPPAPVAAPQPAKAPAPPLAPPPAPPPIRPEALVAGARALRAAGDLDDARELLEGAARSSPGSDEARLELADLLLTDGRELDRAAALLDGVRVRQGARWDLLAGRTAEVRGDDASAVAAYARSLASRDDPDVRLRRALALDRLGRGDEATQELERVRTERPRDAAVRTRLGERYEAAGRLAEAESEFRAAAEAQPERAAVWERLARFYESAGRKAEAGAALAKAKAKGAGGRPTRTLRPLLPSRM